MVGHFLLLLRSAKVRRDCNPMDTMTYTLLVQLGAATKLSSLRSNVLGCLHGCWIRAVSRSTADYLSRMEMDIGWKAL